MDDDDCTQFASRHEFRGELATRSTATSPPAPTPILRVEKDLGRLGNANLVVDAKMEALRDHLRTGNATEARKTLLDVLQLISAVNGMIIHSLERFETDSCKARRAILAASAHLANHSEYLRRMVCS